MALSRAGLQKFFGRSAGDAVGFAFGQAAAPALAAPIQELVNHAWSGAPFYPLDVGDLANGVSSGQIPKDWAATEALNNGVNHERFDHLIAVFDTGPGIARAYNLWHRGILDVAGFRKALKRESLEDEWIDALVAAREVLLSPADLAAARQRGFIDAARQHSESAKQGLDAERADLLFELSGLPPGPERAMVMWRRGIIGPDEFKQTIVEGNEKLKYTDEEAALFYELEPIATLVNLRLRGWIEDGEYHNRMAKHGFDADTADDLFHAIGRPATTRQVMLGLRRGGVYGAPLADTPQPFRDAIIRSDIRPEWANLLYEGRETYPSAFVVRGLVSSGEFTAAQGEDILYKAGWNRDLAHLAAQTFARGTGTTSKGLTVTDLANEYEARWISRAQYVSGLKQLGYSDASANAKADAEESTRTRKARDQRITLIGARYIAHQIGRDRAVTELDAAQVPARVRDSLLVEWDAQRALTPDAMTPAQIKKAWYQVRMTRAEAVARLEFKGYDAADAEIYLDE